MDLNYIVNNQRLTKDNSSSVISDSNKYIYAQFTFTDDWSSLTRYVQFAKGETKYELKLDSTNKVLVPWELMTAAGTILIACYGINATSGVQISTNSVSLKVDKAGVLEDTGSLTPTESSVTLIQEYANTASTKASEASTSEANASTSASNAAASAKSVADSAAQITQNKQDIKTLSDGKVSKTGDTFSGRLTCGNIMPLIKTTDDNYMQICGSTGTANGGSVILWGKSSSNAGKVQLKATDGTNSTFYHFNADGTTQCPTPATTDNSTKIATTAFMRNYLNNYRLTGAYYVPSSVTTLKEIGNVLAETTDFPRSGNNHYGIHLCYFENGHPLNPFDNYTSCIVFLYSSVCNFLAFSGSGIATASVINGNESSWHIV